MQISSEQVKQLRMDTGASVMDCNHALQEAEGDFTKALEILKRKGAQIAEKKSERLTKQGLVESYIHTNGKVGVLVDVRCETDFVARNSEFKQLIHDLALHIAAMRPSYVSREEISAEILENERRVYREECVGMGKKEEILNEIVEGKLKKYLEMVCLLDQPFVKNPDSTISELVKTYIAKLGENIRIARFVRYEI